MVFNKEVYKNISYENNAIKVVGAVSISPISLVAFLQIKVH